MTTVPQGAGRAPTTASGSHRITRTGADRIIPPAPQTAWQRDRARGALLPMHNEFVGRHKLATWVVLLTVCTLFWAAVFGAVLS